ncbi:MAG: nucleotidyltransferase family protein [Woeseia sp.]|nr:nucleotidyltransferase family protein [Woeseia sp.]NNE59974.1 nucleotidyltransferase family protein [Woeseia sp.]
MTRSHHSRRQNDLPAKSQPRLFAIVLAAGTASRFGAIKQLAIWRGQTLVARAARLAEQLCAARSVLVSGYASREVHAACAPLQGYLVVNDDYPSGLGSSIACGVAAVGDASDGVLVMLADQPRVTIAHLEALASAWRTAPDCAVASRYSGDIGVPAIFPASDFDELQALTGDRGARKLLIAHGTALRIVDCEAAALDVDHPADLDSL